MPNSSLFDDDQDFSYVYFMNHILTEQERRFIIKVLRLIIPCQMTQKQLDALFAHIKNKI